MADLRLTISLSGGASLGAYQAGACAALLTAVDHLREEAGVDVRIDAVGGASAGAIVSLIVAHAVLNGIDGAEALREAWVERVSIDTLLRRGSRGPLSLEDVRKDLPGLLGDAPRRREGQPHPVMLHVSLTGLRGLTYEIPGLRDDEPLLGVTYADWKDFRLEPGGGVDQLLEPDGSSPMETAMASASHPGAFAPRALDRRMDTDDYEHEGLSNLPRSGWLWYTDGGLVQHEPIGRLLTAASAVDDGEDDAHRLTLMIHPRSKEPSDAEEWSDPDHEATWAEGLSRGLAVVSEQPLYDDLRKVHRDNARLRRLAELQLDNETRATVRELAGLEGKRHQQVDLISPLLIAERAGEDVADLLAGELMGDFGGFLDEDLRESDFALGYESALCWARDGLGRCGLPDDAVEGAVEAIEDACPISWEEAREGRSTERDLPWRARLRLAHFLLRMVRALLR